MKIRSKALYEYLVQENALHGTPEQLALAKIEWRKLYKKRWKQQQRPRKEIRFEITLKQYQAIKTTALAYGVPPTTHCKAIIISSVEKTPAIPHREVLLHVLQLLGMAINTLQKDGNTHKATELLTRAEHRLLTYLTAP